LPDEDIEESKYDSTGLPRGYSLEALSGFRQATGLQSTSLGLKASGYADTLYFGSLSGSITLQSQDVLQNGVASQRSIQPTLVFRQVGMPFDGGWRADNSLGMINLPAVDLARKSPRISLPSPSMQGFTSEWRQGADFSLAVSTGQPGRFAGFPVTGFTVSNGNYTGLLASTRFKSADAIWSVAGMTAQANGVSSILAATPTGPGLLDAQGVYLAARRESGAKDAERYLQINAITGSNSGSDFQGNRNTAANALWFDGGFNFGAHQNTLGLFRMEPGLAWLDTPMASDLQGAYWRYSHRTRQWQTETALELFNSITGVTPNGYFANTTGRYQYSTSTSFGSTLSVRRFGAQAQSMSVYAQFANDWGNSRAQLEVASADTGERQLQIKFDHDWSHMEDVRLSTSLLFDRDHRLSGESQSQGFAINADWPLQNNLSLNNSFQGRWSTDQTQYTLNAALTWRISPKWSLQSSIYAIQGTSGAVSLAQSPLTPPVVASTTTQDMGVSVILRFDENAGRGRAPVGGAPGSAAGTLMGSVFLDANQDGLRNASEQGAPNVTVVLDGRFSTQTDAQGRFEFAYIAAGAHVLTVISDNLPLPWGLEKEGRTEVRVFTRDTTAVNIGAVRQ
jgi:hypothetical protein